MKKYILLVTMLFIAIASLLYFIVANGYPVFLEVIDGATKDNPVVSGVMSLWILGSLTYLCRDIPKRLWGIVKKQITMTMTLNNIDFVYDDFLEWYYNSGHSSKSRTLVAKNKDHWYMDDDTKAKVSAGYGTHYFKYNGKIFRMHREEKEASQTKSTKEAITITTIGRSQNTFHSLLKEISKKEEGGGLTIYKWQGGTDGHWRRYRNQDARYLDSVVIPKEIKSSLVNHISNFMESREWHIRHGIPYRTGIILHGPPGTGKTSIVKALCNYFDKPLYYLSLSGVNDLSVEGIFSSLPTNSILLIEDIDTYSVTKDRGEGQDSSVEEFSLLTLSGLLNAIDGVMSTEGRILIATTNHIEKLDKALVRKGRFNIDARIDNLNRNGFVDFFGRFYPDFNIDDDMHFEERIQPAKLQATIMDNLDNPEAVINEYLVK